MLCIPALNEIPAPAACGNHHIFRSKGLRLLIILCPRKSITVGLTCVATYKAPECANGLSSGFCSVPNPPEIACLVEYASKAAAPCPANASPTHSIRCLGVSSLLRTANFGGFAGLIGSAAKIGAAFKDEDSPAAPLALSGAIFGEGAAGKAPAASSFAISILALSVVEEKLLESLSAIGTACGKLIIRRAAVRNIGTTSVAASSAPFTPAKKRHRSRLPQYAVPRDRLHWPNGHILCRTTV